MTPADGSGLQPSEMFLNDAPGALPQAGMSSAVGAGVVWKPVAKHDILKDKHVVLLAERWGNGEADFGESDSAPLGEIVEKVSDTIAPSSMPSGTPCVGLEHIGQGTGTLEGNVPSDPTTLKSAKVRFAEGDILYGKLRPNLNKVWLASFAGICSTDCFALRPDRARVEPRLLQFLMLSPQFNEQVLSFVRGAQLPRVSYDDLASIEIPLPPLEEQRRIVAEIEGYQKVLDGARQILAGYKPKLPSDLDCERVSLESLFKLSSGKSLGEKHRTDGTHPVYGGNGVTGYHSEYFAESETLVIGRVGAYCGAVHLTKPKSWITDNALYVTKWLREADQSFVAYALKEAELNSYANQGGQPYISQGIIANVEIPLPPLPEQRRLVAELDAEAAQMDSVRSLLPRFEAKIQRVLDRVWGNTPEATP